jgi:hypothetical protein
MWSNSVMVTCCRSPIVLVYSFFDGYWIWILRYIQTSIRPVVISTSKCTLCLFIRSLFSDAVNIFDYIVSNGSEKLIGNEEGSGRGLVRSIPEFSSRDWGTHKIETSLSIVVPWLRFKLGTSKIEVRNVAFWAIFDCRDSQCYYWVLSILLIEKSVYWDVYVKVCYELFSVRWDAEVTTHAYLPLPFNAIFCSYTVNVDCWHSKWHKSKALAFYLQRL